jgi:hypothetical protein
LIGGVAVSAICGGFKAIRNEKYQRELDLHQKYLDKAKQQHTHNYLNQHPELIDLAKEQYIQQQARQKAHNAVYSLIDINGNVDEDAILEALQK